MNDVSPLRLALEAARKQLLDLSARNRLVNTRRRQKRSSSIEIVDERFHEVYRILVDENRGMNFLPAPDAVLHDDQTLVDTDELFAHLAQPDDKANGVSDRHTDTHLQTALKSKTLQGRLLRLHYDARTAEEEQGVNLLYLAIGFLQWTEREDSQKVRSAPLILVPVTLDRPNASSKFVLRWSGHDIVTNLSLQAKLQAEFGIGLPSIEDADEFDPTTYLDQVERAVADKPDWIVCRERYCQNSWMSR